MTTTCRRHDEDTTVRRRSDDRHKPGFGPEPRLMTCHKLGLDAEPGLMTVVALSLHRRVLVVMSSSCRRSIVVVLSAHRRQVVFMLSSCRRSDIATSSSWGPNYRQKPPVVELLLPLENLVCMCLEFS